MNMILYSNQGDPRQLTKDLTLIGSGHTLEVTEAVSITDPVFLMDLNTTYIGANYCYCSEFNRYYFINNIEIVNGNQMRLYCHVDVLMSHKDSILKSSCISERSSSNPDPFISDPLVGDRGTYETWFRNSGVTPFTGSSYLLTVAGK